MSADNAAADNDEGLLLPGGAVHCSPKDDEDDEAEDAPPHKTSSKTRREYAHERARNGVNMPLDGSVIARHRHKSIAETVLTRLTG